MGLVFDEKISRIKLPYKINSLDLTNDGTLLAVSLMADEGSSQVLVYDTETSELIAEFGKEAVLGRGVAFSANKNELFLCLENNENDYVLYKANIENSSIERIAKYEFGSNIHDVVRDPTSQVIAVIGRYAEIWDMSCQEVIRNFELIEPGRGFLKGNFSGKDLDLYLYNPQIPEVVQCNIIENKIVNRWEAPTISYGTVIVSPSGEYLMAFGNGCNGAFLYNTKTGEKLRTRRYDGKKQTTLHTFSHDSKYLIKNFRNSIQFYNLKTEEIGEQELKIKFESPMTIASAWEAPIIAFGEDYNIEDKENPYSLSWVRYREE